MAEEDLEEILNLHHETPGAAETIRQRRGFKIFIIALLAILMILIGWIIFGGKSGNKEFKKTAQTQETQKKGPLPLYPTLPLKTINFFIRDQAEEKSFFVKIQLTLAYKSKKEFFLKELEQRELEMTDLILTLFSKKVFEDINTPEKREILKGELKEVINQVLINGQIEEIFISEFNILLN